MGYGRGGRMKIETDTVEIISGVRHGKTLGSPIAIQVEKQGLEKLDRHHERRRCRSTRGKIASVTRPRPGHADLAGGQKFGARDLRNILERASARETAARWPVAAWPCNFLLHSTSR